MPEGTKNVCALIKSPPIDPLYGPQYVGKSIAELRVELADQLEIAPGAPVMVSKDKGKTYERKDENYIVQNMDVVEFGRGSSTKGCNIES